MKRAWYTDSITQFLVAPDEEVLGKLTAHSHFEVTLTQREAWLEQIRVLRKALASTQGSLYFEFTIPRLGRRIDAIVILGSTLFIIEFKVGKATIDQRDLDQVLDYALDLHNFHLGSHAIHIAPVLVCTGRSEEVHRVSEAAPRDRVFEVTITAPSKLRQVLDALVARVNATPIAVSGWEASGYQPTPTIIEAALALYGGHAVADISRSDAGAENLTRTSATVEEIIRRAKEQSFKAICFVTGVPGAGKTLVGLNAATRHRTKDDEHHSIYLSGNGPLVAILQEALARDRMRRADELGQRIRKGQARSEVKTFIQNVHHFRDEYLRSGAAPFEHVAIFDEAQRAWNLAMTADFMKRKKGQPNFAQSEPEFLISCLDRHRDWAVVVCLVGGGQEINRGEGGINEWLAALDRSFRAWRVFVSDRLTDSEYGAGAIVEALRRRSHVEMRPELHLASSMRSFRSEKVSQFVKELLDLESDAALLTLASVRERYPVVLMRDLGHARTWLRSKARGSERYGIVVSSNAERLKPYAVDVKSPVDPVKWFLNAKDDVRSSYYLEDVATEFHVQGLELDWACVMWDADLRFGAEGWEHWSFHGSRWKRIEKLERKNYLKNAYRVLLTRARQGMVIVVPQGDPSDPTRDPRFYDPTYEYLKHAGFTSE